MNHINVSMVTEVKHGKAWDATYTTNNPAEVYKKLSSDLIAKKLSNAAYIHSIKRVQNYDGTITVIVVYNDGNNNYNVRSVYTVESH